MCLIGPSGCGKSTLLNVIGGLLAPTAGTVEVLGKKVAGPMPRDIAFVFQENALFPWNTVRENVDLGMRFQGVPRAERAERAQRALEAVGLKDFADHFPGQLSGGMRQRAALARALSLQTDILLMDEPFGALDEQTRMILGEDLSVLLAATAQDHRVRHPQPGRGGVPRRPRRGVLGAPRHHQAGDHGRRAASAQAGIRHLGEIHQAAQPALRPAARRDPQDRVGGGGAARHAGSAVVRQLAVRVVQVAVPVALVVLWYLATTRWGVSRILLPNPVEVVRALGNVLATGEYANDLRVTLTELAIAFAISVSGRHHARLPDQPHRVPHPRVRSAARRRSTRCR